MKLKQRETGRQGVMRACEDLLKASLIRYWRMNAGDRFGSYKGKRWRIRGHPKGTPDLLASVKLGEGLCGPKFLWIECKSSGGIPTVEQLQFGDEARRNGEYWLVISDVTELQDWMRQNRAR